MDEQKNKQHEGFVKRLVNEAGLEEPPSNFTDIILLKIEAVQKNSKVFDYQPLISKKTWWFLAAVVLVFFGCVIFRDPDIETSFPYFFELNRLAFFDVSTMMPNFAISDTFVYGFMALAFFISIQVFILDRRLARTLK